MWIDHRLRAARAVGACDEDRPRVREPVCSLEGAKQLPRRAAAEPHAFRPRHAARQWKTGRKGSQIALRSTEFLYQVARVVMTARQRDGLSEQPAASPAASRRRGSRQPGSHTRWQHPPTHTDVDARVALPPAGQLSRACTRTRAAGERQLLLRCCSGLPMTQASC